VSENHGIQIVLEACAASYIDTGAAEVVEIAGARLFFPDERAGELSVALRRHWHAHAR
jgi:hypothetical protein